jgi:hypothetical protein
MLRMEMSFVLLVGMCGVLHAHPPEEKAAGNWFTRLWGGKKNQHAEAKNAAAGAAAGATAGVNPAAQVPPSVTVTTKVLSDRLIRRSEVVLKLHEIAARKNDEKLRRMAEQLDQRLVDSVRASGPYHASFRSDEQVLDNHLGLFPHDAGAGLTQRGVSAAPVAGRKEAP